MTSGKPSLRDPSPRRGLANASDDPFGHIPGGGRDGDTRGAAPGSKWCAANAIAELRGHPAQAARAHGWSICDGAKPVTHASRFVDCAWAFGAESIAHALASRRGARDASQ